VARLRISKSSVDAAQPSDRDRLFWDDKLAGFGLKITPRGRKVYVYRYRIARPGEAAKTHPITYTIGTHGSVTPDEARKLAGVLAGRVAEGGNPQVERSDRKRASVIDKDLGFIKRADLWLEHYEHEKGRRPSSVDQAKLVVRNHLKPGLKDRPLPLIGRADIQAVIDRIPIQQKAMRRAVFAYASVFFGWAASRGDIPRNPLIEMAKPDAPKARDRTLNDGELISIWRASTTLKKPFGPFYRLLIITGQRRNEVASLRWEDLDRELARWTIPADKAKNGQVHIVPLTQLTILELDALAGDNWPASGYVLTTTGKNPISGFSKAKKLLDAKIAKEGKELPDWRVHDLRRTLATGLQRLGVRFEVTEAVLNHISGAKGGVAGIYQRHDWLDEKRAALDAWATELEHLLAGKDNPHIIKLVRA
jgi:integrase